MDLIVLVVVCVAVGFCVWLLTTRVPLPPGWATAIQVLTLLVLVIYVLERIVRLPNFLH